MALIHGCHLCQISRNVKPPGGQFHKQKLFKWPKSRLRMGLKVKPRSTKGHEYIPVIIDEVTNYL